MKTPEDENETNHEIAVRLTPGHPVVARLIELQGAASNAAFAERWLKPDCSVSSWGRIRDGKFHATDHARMLEKLEGRLAGLERHHAADTAARAADIAGTALVRLGMRAVDRAFAEPRDRLVAILSPTGGGKTTFARALASKHQGLVRVEASETWRSSYLAACHALLRALGHGSLPGGARASESALLDALRASPKLIVVDEAHYFGPGTINLVKAILNQTASTVVMLSIPELWERMKRAAWEESQQLRSRTCAVVAIDTLAEKDVALVFARRLETPLRAAGAKERDARDMVAAIRAEANRFGLMATVARILGEIEADLAEGEPLAAETVLRACEVVAALRR